MQRLIIYRNLLKDKHLLLLNDIIDNEDNNYFIENYYKFCSYFINNGNGSVLDQILSLVLLDENIFSLSAENNLNTNNFKKAVLHDINILKEISTIDFKKLSEKAGDKNAFIAQTDILEISKIFKGNNSEFIFSYLYNYYKESGCGELSKYNAFRLNYEMELEPIKNFNPKNMEILYGCESQKKRLIHNTKRFLNGNPGQNVLLFGDRGTGKSTIIKSLLTYFNNSNLRLIEIDKDKIRALPNLIDNLGHRNFNFILFIDDLSFNSDDGDFKLLKSIIQGSIYENTTNILFYVSSNRRNLVRQSFIERDNEVNVNDLLNETVSLTDRFGLKLSFHKPIQKEYIEIVKYIAKMNNIKNIESILEEAIQYANRNGGFNGRSAKQFIDSKIVH